MKMFYVKKNSFVVVGNTYKIFVYLISQYWVGVQFEQRMFED